MTEWDRHDVRVRLGRKLVPTPAPRPYTTWDDQLVYGDLEDCCLLWPEKVTRRQRVSKAKSPYLSVKRHWGGFGRGREETAPKLKVGGKKYDLHRAVWWAHYGDPGQLVVRSKCDRLRCGNPRHLELGTQTQNNQDRARRDRSYHNIPTC